MVTFEEVVENNRLNGLERRLTDPMDLDEIFSKLKEARKKLPSTIQGRFDVIKDMAEKWRNPDYSPRRKLLPLLAEETPYTTQMIEYLTFSSFGQIAEMGKLFEVDMEDMKPCFKNFYHVPGIDGLLLRVRIDDLSILEKLKLLRQDYDIDSLLENSPELTTSICAGNAPGLPVHQMNMALSLGSASLIKNSSEETLLGPAYLESMIMEGYGDIASSFEILTWSREDEEITRYAVENSDAVILTGGTRAVKAIKELVEGVDKEVIYDPHGHKAGISVIAREYLMDVKSARDVARCSAIDFVSWNQYACLSPREIRVERGGNISPEEFSEMLAEELLYVGQKLGPDAPGNIHRKKLYRRYIGSEDVDMKSHPNDLEFGIVLYTEKDGSFDPYSTVCMNRTVFVKPIDDIYEVTDVLKPYRDVLQTVSVAVPKGRIISYSEKLSEIGVSNIRSVGNSAFPRIGEPWDGRFAPFNLLNPIFNKIRWTSLSADIDHDIQYALDRFDDFTPTKFEAYQ